MIVTNQRVFFRLLYQSQKAFRHSDTMLPRLQTGANPARDPKRPLLITGILELQISYFDILIRTIIECQ